MIKNLNEKGFVLASISKYGPWWREVGASGAWGSQSHYVCIYRRTMHACAASFPFCPYRVWELLPREWSVHRGKVFPYLLVTIKIIPHEQAQRSTFQSLQIVSCLQATFNFYGPAFPPFIKFRQDQRTWRISQRVKGKANVWGQYSLWSAKGTQILLPLVCVECQFLYCSQKLGHLLLAIGPGNFFFFLNSISDFTFPGYITEYSLHTLANSWFSILYILYILVLFTDFT